MNWSTLLEPFNKQLDSQKKHVFKKTTIPSSLSTRKSNVYVQNKNNTIGNFYSQNQTAINIKDDITKEKVSRYSERNLTNILDKLEEEPHELLNETQTISVNSFSIKSRWGLYYGCELEGINFQKLIYFLKR